MKKALVPSLVRTLIQALARTLYRAPSKPTEEGSRSCGTSPIGDSVTTGALCPDDKGGTVRKLRFPATFRTLFRFPHSDFRFFHSAFRIPLSAFLLGGLTASSLFAQRGPQDTWYLEKKIQIAPLPGFWDPRDVTVAPNGEIYVTEADNHRVSVWDDSGNMLRTFGGYGSGNGQFNKPHGIIISGDELYVTDHDNKRVQVFDANGTFLRKWGSNGSGDGQFNGPWGIAADVVGNTTEIYVTELHNHRVQVFDGNGTFLRKWGSSGNNDDQFRYPKGIMIGPDDLVYVSSYDHSKVKVFQKDGTYVRNFDTTDKGHDLCLIGDRIAIGFGTNHRVRIYETNGTLVTTIGTGSTGSGDGEFNKPYFVGADGSGNLLVVDSENQRVQVFDAGGSFVRKFGSLAKFGIEPRDLVVAPNGNLIFSEGSDDRIIEVDENGTYVRHFGGYGSGDGQLKEPNQLAFAPNGNLHVAEYDNHRISIFTRDGEFVKTFGSNGTGDGQFKKPTGVTVATNGEIFVGDDDNHRIQVFDSNGTFLRKWGSYGNLEGQLDHPKYLEFSEEGELYVSNYNRVEIFTPQGTFLRRFNGGGQKLHFTTDGLLMRSLGDLKLTESDGSTIKQFNSLGGAHQHAFAAHPSGGIYVFLENYVVGWYRNTYRNIRPKLSKEIPLPEVISVAQREGTNYVDVSFRIHDADSATVTAGLLAFIDGGTDLSKVIVPETFVGDVTGKLGENVATGQVHTITWNAGADWNVGFGELEMEVLAKDDRDLLNYHLLTLPPTDNNNTELVISRSPITEADLLDIWYWMVASGSSEISFQGGNVGEFEAPLGVFSPASIGSLKMWLDATDVDGDGQADSLADGADVTTWVDKAGGDHNASGGDSPTYAAAGLNGHPSVHFDGSADYLAFPEITDIRTVFWVMSKDADAGNGRTLLGSSSTTHFETAGDGKFWSSSYASYYVKYGSTYLGGMEIVAHNTATPTGPFLLSTVTTGNVSANQLTKDRTYGRYWKGEIAEILIYNAALGDADRRNVQQYLAEKWGVASFNNTYAQGSTTTASGKAYLLDLLGLREATSTEVTRAKHAGTPGIINQFTPTFKVGPDERPVKVNEYGFDVGATGGFWVVPVEEEGSN